MKLKLLLLLFIGLLGFLTTNTAAAQTSIGEQRDAIKAAHFIKSHPEYASAFTTKGAMEGMMICTSKDALTAFDYAQRNEAAAPKVVELGTMNGVPQTSEAPQELRANTPTKKRTSAEVDARIEELETLRKEDPANADKYTGELKQLRQQQASSR